MYCHKCGVAIPDGANFCEGCGNKVEAGTKSPSQGKAETSPTPSSNSTAPIVTEGRSEAIIKCGNCGYIGPGELARSTWATVLAWICVVFAPVITILYFVVTHKYRCPKCHSTFLGVKNKEGEFTKGQSGAARAATILIAIFVGIAIIGILSAVVLASLNTARSKGRDAAIQSNLATIQTAAEIYYGGVGNNSYGTTAFDCTSGMFAASQTIANSIVSANNTNGYVTCNSTRTEYAVQAQLSTDSTTYWCIDSTGNAKQENTPMATGATVCQ